MNDNIPTKYYADTPPDVWGFIETSGDYPTGPPEEPWKLNADYPTRPPEEPW